LNCDPDSRRETGGDFVGKWLDYVSEAAKAIIAVAGRITAVVDDRRSSLDHAPVLSLN